MYLHPSIIDWDDAHCIQFPNLSRDVLLKIQASGIGNVLTGKTNMSVLILDTEVDLAGLHSILAGNYEEWTGSINDLPLLRLIIGYMESHPAQDMFCFLATDNW